MQFTKVKKGSSDLKSKQASSFQKVNVLQNSEKVPYSKSSFYNQLIKYPVSVITLTNDKYRRKKLSQHHCARLFSNSLNLIHIVIHISHFRGLLIVIFRRIKWKRNIKLKIVVFKADSILKFSAEMYIFIKHSKNWYFLYFLIDSPVQCSPKKANLMQNFCSRY